jgi:hypothetical protein
LQPITPIPARAPRYQPPAPQLSGFCTRQIQNSQNRTAARVLFTPSARGHHQQAPESPTPHGKQFFLVIFFLSLIFFIIISTLRFRLKFRFFFNRLSYENQIGTAQLTPQVRLRFSISTCWQAQYSEDET